MKKYFLILIPVILTLAACGIKPGKLQPPEGSPETDFPRTYPHASTENNFASEQKDHPY